MSFLSSIFGNGTVRSPDITGGLNLSADQQASEEALAYEQYLRELDRFRNYAGRSEEQYNKEVAALRDSIAREGAGRADLNKYLTALDVAAAEAQAADRAAQNTFNDSRRDNLQGNLDATAEQARRQAEARQKFITDSFSEIDQQFAGYDDAFYGQFAKGYISSRLPGLEQQYDDQRRGTVFNLTDKGNAQSSAAARLFGRLAQARAADEGVLANDAVSGAQNLRANMESQREGLRSQALFASLLAKPPASEGETAPGFTLKNTTNAYNTWYNQQLGLGLKPEDITGGSGFSAFEDRILSQAGRETDRDLISRNIREQTARLNDPLYGKSAQKILAAFQNREKGLGYNPTMVDPAPAAIQRPKPTGPDYLKPDLKPASTTPSTVVI